MLTGKRGLIFGAVDENSLAWRTALRCKEMGAQIVLTNSEAAVRLGSIAALAAEHQMPLIACDATDTADLEHLLVEAQRILGGKLDFVLHAVAQSQNLRRHREYDDTNYSYYQQTIDVSALSLHKLLQTAKSLDAIAEYGSVVTLTFLASERAMEGYNDMADAKAMLESIVRNFGRIYGQSHHVRINAVSQSPTPTKAGGHWDEIDYFYRYCGQLSPLGLADADDCANTCVALFSDLMRKVTMQTIYNDGGFSHTMLTSSLIEACRGKI